MFGRINEYFLTQFADQKAHDNGEFFTPVIFYIMNCGDSVATIMLHRIILYCIQFLHNPRIRIRQD
ncbi:N-6 DNA methylase [Methanospirillum sp.]|uniref:N-6 DNA methylase n=1 Tax=Methanospirillum sp. TaxID=45200 RepID=UPI001BD52212